VLRQPDTSSPRATLQGFIGALDEAYVRFAVLLTEYAASNRLYFDAEEWRSYREAFASIFASSSAVPPLKKMSWVVTVVLTGRWIASTRNPSCP